MPTPPDSMVTEQGIKKAMANETDVSHNVSHNCHNLRQKSHF